MDWGRVIADETAYHYRQLRDRHVPWPLALILTYRFHQSVCVAFLMGDSFEDEVRKILNTPLTDTRPEKPDRKEDDDDHYRIVG